MNDQPRIEIIGIATNGKQDRSTAQVFHVTEPFPQELAWVEQDPDGALCFAMHGRKTRVPVPEDGGAFAVHFPPETDE